MHIEKAKAGQFIGLALHDERACENHTNEKIDPSRSHLNYNLCDGNVIANYNARMENVYMRKNKDANVIVMISNTLPKDFPEERKEEFFKYSHEFFCDFFGKENVISDWVHGDETSWHQHIKAIPTYFNEKKQRETVSFDRVMTRSVYKSMHKDLQNHLEKKMGIPVPILNGATAGGNKTIQELKNEEIIKERERLKKEVEELKKEADRQRNEMNQMKQQMDHDVMMVENYMLDTEYKLEKLDEKVQELKEEIIELPYEEMNIIEKFINKVTRFIRDFEEKDLYGTPPDNVVIDYDDFVEMANSFFSFQKIKDKLTEIIKGVKELASNIQKAMNIRDKYDSGFYIPDEVKNAPETPKINPKPKNRDRGIER